MKLILTFIAGYVAAVLGINYSRKLDELYGTDREQIQWDNIMNRQP